jgi:hypothetical protein
MSENTHPALETPLLTTAVSAQPTASLENSTFDYICYLNTFSPHSCTIHFITSITVMCSVAISRHATRRPASTQAVTLYRTQLFYLTYIGNITLLRCTSKLLQEPKVYMTGPSAFKMSRNLVLIAFLLECLLAAAPSYARNSVVTGFLNYLPRQVHCVYTF